MSPRGLRSPARSGPTPRAALALMAGLAAAAAGCSSAIGDSCNASLDCSVQGDRICDEASPSGYCTIPNCEANECPDEAICVEFLSEPQRLTRTYCMRRCSSSGDCRQDEGYRCRSGDDLPSETLDPATGEPIPIAFSLDGNPSRRFCVYVGDVE